jgi:uncharacterized protein YkwD
VYRAAVFADAGGRAVPARRRYVVFAVACAAVLLASAVASTTAAAGTIPPRKQLLHAINDIRAAYGVGSLHGVSALRWVALSHSEDMVRRDYFAHTSPTGSTLAYRIQRSGFVSSYSWRAGETLAWGTGAHASARATAEAWLKSSVHRAIMLSPTYRWVGIGRQCGRYRGYTDACFWTADFVIRW